MRDRTRWPRSPCRPGGRQTGTLAYRAYDLDRDEPRGAAHSAARNRSGMQCGSCLRLHRAGCLAASNQDLPSGNIRMRLAPGGVEPIIALASKDGEVTSRNTSAEDLAEPVADYRATARAA